MSPGFRSTSSNDGGDDQPSPLERLRRAMLKPTDTGYAPSAVNEMTIPELEAANGTLNDRERVIGLVAAPLAALVGLLIVDNSISHDPVPILSGGGPNPKYVSISLYHELLVVLLVMAALMILTSYLRKRLFLGIVMALYGLAVFNLHGYGFGIPFVLGGAWYLVRQYRLQQKLKEAGLDPGGFSPTKSRARPSGTLPRPNKRYTPRMAPRPRPGKPPKPEND
jgi:hypothetical protein